MTSVHAASPRSRTPSGWTAVAAQELRDLWLGGRGLVLSFAFAALVGVLAYVVAANQSLNFLEQRESVNLTLQVAIAVGSLLVLLAAADSVSGERERATIETLLLAPVSRLAISTGKLVAALSLWLAAFAITIPYVWYLGKDIDLDGVAIGTGLLVGTLLAVFLAGLGHVVSTFSGSNRVSLSVCLFVLLVLFAPTQFPLSARQGVVAETLLRVNPVTAGEHFVGRVLVDAHNFRDEASWLVSPIVAAALAIPAAALASRFLRIGGMR